MYDSVFLFSYKVNGRLYESEKPDLTAECMSCAFVLRDLYSTWKTINQNNNSIKVTLFLVSGLYCEILISP